MQAFLISYLLRLAQLRGFAYGLAFLLYQWLFQPVLLERLLAAEKHGRADLWLGMGLLVLQVLDLSGFRLKWPMLKERVLRWPAPSEWGKIGYYLALLTRLGLFAILFLNGLFAFGIDPRHAEGLSGLAMLGMFFLLIAKEGLILACFFEGWQPGPALDLSDTRTQLRELGGEVLLMISAMTTFSLTWDYLLLTVPPIEPESKFFGTLGAVAMFLILYPASRLPFVAEEALTRQSLPNRIVSGVFWGLNLLVCLSQVPGI